MNVTGTGIAVALAVVIALAFLFFGPIVFSPFTASAPTTVDESTSGTSNDTSATAMEPILDPNAPLPTSLTGRDDVVGTGAEAKAGDTVSVQYVGMLPDGTVFDASKNHGGQPFTFTLGAGQVIKGWDQGLVGMKVGGTRTLVIPPDMAYGNQAVGGIIPANATLVFQVELVSIQ